jgi:hypothetical protein
MEEFKSPHSLRNGHSSLPVPYILYLIFVYKRLSDLTLFTEYLQTLSRLILQNAFSQDLARSSHRLPNDYNTHILVYVYKRSQDSYARCRRSTSFSQNLTLFTEYSQNFVRATQSVLNVTSAYRIFMLFSEWLQAPTISSCSFLICYKRLRYLHALF